MPGKGEVRTALEALLHERLRLSVYCHEISETIRQAADATADLAGKGDPRGTLARDVAARGAITHGQVQAALLPAADAYDREAHRLLGLLAGHHGQRRLAPLGPAQPFSTNVNDIARRFPRGFARNYVKGILNDAADSTTMTREEAAQVPTIEPGRNRRVIQAIGAHIDGRFRAEVVTLLGRPASHAVAQHGPHVTADHLKAQLIYLKDFTGKFSWSLQADGRIAVDPRFTKGARNGSFTSAEAFAKPLNAVMRHAHQQGGLTNFLNNHAVGRPGAKKIAVFIDARDAQLVPGDAQDYRQTGPRTLESTQDWSEARLRSIRHGGPSVNVVKTDPIASGGRPGATLVFTETRRGWALKTAYVSNSPRPADMNLKDLT